LLFSTLRPFRARFQEVVGGCIGELGVPLLFAAVVGMRLLILLATNRWINTSPIEYYACLELITR